MQHATPKTLTAIELVLKPLRAAPRLKESTPGSFYRNAAGLLHSYKDPAGLFADLKIHGAFKRFPDNTAMERSALLAGVARELDRAKALS